MSQLPLTPPWDSSRRPKVLLIVGYFDWFSGYQETSLATALSSVADVEVLCSDRVSPAFSVEHLRRLNVPRRYASGSLVERGVTLTRVKTREWRSMVWGWRALSTLRKSRYDLCIQVMPGQGLPVAASIVKSGLRRVVLYGDNRAMYEGLSRSKRVAKLTVFALTKGVIYMATNLGADVIYGYTPNTLKRLRLFSMKPLELLPLAFDARNFYFDPALRANERASRGYLDSDLVIIVAGKFERRKRLDWIIEAFERLAAHQPDAQLLFVGADDSLFAHEIREMSSSSRYRGQIRVEGFLGSVQLNGAFNAADIGVWPIQPAISIQQTLGTGLLVCLPDNDLVGHLIRPGAGRYFVRGSHGDAVGAITDALMTLATEDRTDARRMDRSTQNSILSVDSAVATILTRTLGDWDGGPSVKW